MKVEQRLVVLLDGIEIQAINGETSWTSVEVDIPAGDHLLQWRLEEGASGNNGAAHVRRLEFD